MIINNFDDILQAMEQDPALREAMRRHILTEELLQLPVQVSRLETRMDDLEAGQEDIKSRIDNLEDGQKRLEAGQEELKGRMDNLEAGQNRLEAGQEELKGRMDTMAGRLGDAVGHAYENQAVRMAPRRLRQALGIRNATLILGAKQPGGHEIHHLLEDAVETSRISEAEADDLERLDLAFTGHDPSGNAIHTAIEASITISPEDIRRAMRRADILERATQVPSRPAVIGENISPEDQAEAENLGVAFLHMPAHQE